MGRPLMPRRSPGTGRASGAQNRATAAPGGSSELNRALDALLAYESPARHFGHREAMQSIAMLYVVLPYPPTTNHLYATYRGRRIKSEAGREYEVLCAAAVREAVEPTEPLPLPPFALVMHLYTPDRRPRDLDGCLKAPIDNVFRALKTTDYRIDDSMIEEMHVYKHLDRERPRLEMVLSQFRPKGSAR